jgi:hypothetical protein
MAGSAKRAALSYATARHKSVADSRISSVHRRAGSRWRNAIFLADFGMEAVAQLIDATVSTPAAGR